MKASTLIRLASNASGNTVPEANVIDRRSRQRIRFESPATVTTCQHTIAASAKDISDRGLFFFTDAHFEVGSEIDIVIALPEQLGLPLNGMVCCHARVVRSDFGLSQRGVAAQIDRFAAMPQV